MNFTEFFNVGTVYLGYEIVAAIPGYGKRLYVQRLKLTNEHYKVFNALSLWGGYDKSDETFVSWEFGDSVSNEVILKLLLVFI
jgi:hypothetical protein